jgi:actin related protein 2/3 complex, subunit 3
MCVQCQSRIQAQKELTSLAMSTFPMPGDADFPLNGMFVKPTHDEAGSLTLAVGRTSHVVRRSSFVDKMKQYLEQLRKECGDRMVDRVIDRETDKPSKVDRRRTSDVGRDCRRVSSGGCASFVVDLWTRVC